MEHSLEHSVEALELMTFSESDLLGAESGFQEMGFSDTRLEDTEVGVIISFDGDSDLNDLLASRTSGYRKTVSDDAVGAFFKEMARYPLLKPNEEIELARRVKFLNEIEDLRLQMQTELERPPTKADIAARLGLNERQLEHRLYLSRVAKRKMIRSNLRLVVSIAKRYLNR
ncbi:MAG TPA: sigma-70 factor domain-containing protein, partial [Allocoleopsis sp.]